MHSAAFLIFYCWKQTGTVLTQHGNLSLTTFCPHCWVLVLVALFVRKCHWSSQILLNIWSVIWLLICQCLFFWYNAFLSFSLLLWPRLCASIELFMVLFNRTLFCFLHQSPKSWHLFKYSCKTWLKMSTPSFLHPGTVALSGGAQKVGDEDKVCSSAILMDFDVQTQHLYETLHPYDSIHLELLFIFFFLK